MKCSAKTKSQRHLCGNILGKLQRPAALAFPFGSFQRMPQNFRNASSSLPDANEIIGMGVERRYSLKKTHNTTLGLGRLNTEIVPEEINKNL